MIPRLKPGSINALDRELRGDFQAAGRKSGDVLGKNIGDGASRRVGIMSKSIIAPLAAGVAALKVKDFIGDSLGEARESQKVGALTASIIKSTGGASKVTAKQVDALSTAISNKTGVDDEAIASGANLLLTFKNVKREGDGLKDVFGRATLAAADLSAAGFGDINGSAKMLGKALNDPLKGITALGRAGVTFTQGQKDQIAAMVEQNDLLGAQSMILGEVESQVGGAAAATSTLGEKSTVAWDNIKEGFGTALLPLVDDMQAAFLEKGIPAAEKFVGWFQDEGIPALRDFGDVAGPLAKSTLPAIGTALGVTADAAKALAPPVKAIIDAFNSLPKAAQTAILVGGAATVLGNKVTGGLGVGLGGTAKRANRPNPKSKGLLGKVGGVASKVPLIAAPGLLTPPGAAAGLTAGVGAYTLSEANRIAKEAKNNLGKRPLPANMGRGNGGGTDQRSQATKDFQAEQAAKKNIEYQKQAVAQTAENERRRKAATQAAIDGYDLTKAKAGELGSTLDVLGQKKIAPKTETPGMFGALKDSLKLGDGLDKIDKKNPKPKTSTPGMAAAIGSAGTLLSQLSAIDKANVSATVKLFKTGANLGGIIGQLNEIERKGKSGGGRVRGFDGGGWTGPGSRLQPAGIVHADEFVVKKTSRQSIERQAPGALDRMNQTGELVGASSGPSITEAGIANALAGVLRQATFNGDGNGGFRLTGMGG